MDSVSVRLFLVAGWSDCESSAVAAGAPTIDMAVPVASICDACVLELRRGETRSV